MHVKRLYRHHATVKNRRNMKFVSRAKVLDSMESFLYCISSKCHEDATKFEIIYKAIFRDCKIRPHLFGKRCFVVTLSWKTDEIIRI